MEAQLHLLTEIDQDEASEPTEWRLDESTRAVGRQGISQARAALRSAARNRRSDEHPRHASAA